MRGRGGGHHIALVTQTCLQEVKKSTISVFGARLLLASNKKTGDRKKSVGGTGRKHARWTMGAGAHTSKARQQSSKMTNRVDWPRLSILNIVLSRLATADGTSITFFANRISKHWARGDLRGVRVREATILETASRSCGRRAQAANRDLEVY